MPRPSSSHDLAAVNAVAESFATAVRLIGDADPALVRIVALSFAVSGTACLIAAGSASSPAPGSLRARFAGRRLVLIALDTLLALPAVVVGLVVYLSLSRSGPLGAWGILFTPKAMVIAQTILVLPIIAALARQVVADALRDGGDHCARWARGGSSPRCSCCCTSAGRSRPFCSRRSGARSPKSAR